METTEGVATTSVDEENPRAESSSFPSLSPMSRWIARNVVRQVMRSNIILAQQSSFESTPRSTFENDHAASNCQSSSLFAVGAAGKSHEFSNSSWMIPNENDHSPSTNWEDINATQTVKAENPSLRDTKAPFDMQTSMASLANPPEHEQHQVMYTMLGEMFGDSRNPSGVSKYISEGWSSACAGYTKLERTAVSTPAVYSASNNESIMEVANGQGSSNKSDNDSDSEGSFSQLPASKQLTAFQLKANAPDGAGIHLPSSNSSHHVHSLHSSELQNKGSSDEMHIRFGNLHLSHNTKQQYTEEKCDLTIANKSSSRSRHACPVCKKAFRYARMLKVHEKHCHNEIHPFPCTVCHQKFNRHFALVQHMYSHGVNYKCQISTYKCEICGETFNCHSSLLRHNWVVHFVICGLTAARGRSATHSDSAVLSSRTEPSTSMTPEHCREEQLFPCVFCGKKFSHKALLSQHRKSHEFSTTYKCETCGQTFSFQSSLAKHRSVHCDAVRNACSMCDKTFSYSTNLKRHQATHLNSTDVKLQTKRTPFAALSSRTEPNASAMSRRGLKGEFSCTFCSKSFNRKINLSLHMKSHERKPSYTCDTCGEAFNYLSNFMFHQSVHSDALGHTSPPGVSSSY